MKPRPIDANAMHKFVEDKVAEGKDGWANGVPYEWAYALTAVDMQPTLDYEPVVHSQWMLHEMHPRRVTVDGFAVCPECEHHFDRIKGTWFKRCPNCGAKMDAEENVYGQNLRCKR